MPALGETTCRERFAAARVARLATLAADGVPHLVPVTLALVAEGDVDVVYSAVDHKPKSSRRLRRIANVEATGVATLLVDRYDEDWSQLWWVRADGAARVVSGDEAARGVDALVHRYPQYDEHRPEGPVIAVHVTRWSGWSAVG